MMKTRFLIAIGIIIVITISLLSYTIYDSSTTVFISCDPRYEQIDDKCVLKISETDYEELECLRLYKNIREISRTDGMALAEYETIDMHKNLIMEYVDIGCPNFPDLKFWSDNYGLASLPEFKSSTQKVIEAFKEKYSEDGITEFPDSKGVPYKYSSKTGADLILEKDRVVLKVWKNDEPLCIVSNPLPRDVWENCPPKW